MLNSLVEAYNSFNPDDETINDRVIVGHERRSQLEKLKAMVVDLVVSANYLEIDQPTLEKFSRKKTMRDLRRRSIFANMLPPPVLPGGEQRQDCRAAVEDAWLRKRYVEVDAYRRLSSG